MPPVPSHCSFPRKRKPRFLAHDLFSDENERQANSRKPSGKFFPFTCCPLRMIYAQWVDKPSG